MKIAPNTGLFIPEITDTISNTNICNHNIDVMEEICYEISNGFGSDKKYATLTIYYPPSYSEKYSVRGSLGRYSPINIHRDSIKNGEHVQDFSPADYSGFISTGRYAGPALISTDSDCYPTDSDGQTTIRYLEVGKQYQIWVNHTIVADIEITEPKHYELYIGQNGVLLFVDCVIVYAPTMEDTYVVYDGYYIPEIEKRTAEIRSKDGALLQTIEALPFGEPSIIELSDIEPGNTIRVIPENDSRFTIQNDIFITPREGIVNNVNHVLLRYIEKYATLEINTTSSDKQWLSSSPIVVDYGTAYAITGFFGTEQKAIFIVKRLNTEMQVSYINDEGNVETRIVEIGAHGSKTALSIGAWSGLIVKRIIEDGEEVIKKGYKNGYPFRLIKTYLQRFAMGGYYDIGVHTKDQLLDYEYKKNKFYEDFKKMGVPNMDPLVLDHVWYETFDDFTVSLYGDSLNYNIFDTVKAIRPGASSYNFGINLVPKDGDYYNGETLKTKVLIEPSENISLDNLFSAKKIYVKCTCVIDLVIPRYVKNVVFNWWGRDAFLNDVDKYVSSFYLVNYDYDIEYDEEGVEIENLDPLTNSVFSDIESKSHPIEHFWFKNSNPISEESINDLKTGKTKTYYGSVDKVTEIHDEIEIEYYINVPNFLEDDDVKSYGIYTSDVICNAKTIKRLIEEGYVSKTEGDFRTNEYIFAEPGEHPLKKIVPAAVYLGIEQPCSFSISASKAFSTSLEGGNFNINMRYDEIKLISE